MTQDIENTWHFVQKWLQIDAKRLRDLDEPRLQQMRDRIREYATAETAYQRMIEIQRVADKTVHEANRQLTTIIITIAGALTYGSAMKIFAANLGQFAIPAALVGGALASFWVDALAKNSLTNYLCSQGAKRAFSKLDRLRANEMHGKGQGFSELSSLFWNARAGLIEELEGISNGSEFPVNTGIGLGLSVIEYVTAVWIVSQAAVLSQIPFWVKLVAAALPVVLTWAAAAIQSQKFEIPDHYAELLNQYQSKLLPPQNLSEQALENWCRERRFQDARLDAGISAILASNHNYKHPTPELAELAFDMDFCEEKIEECEEAMERDKERRKQALYQKVARLPDEFDAMLENAGIGFQERTVKCTQWVDREQGKLEQQHNREIQKIEEIWTKRIDSYRRKAQDAQDAYDAELELWKERTRFNPPRGVA